MSRHNRSQVLYSPESVKELLGLPVWPHLRDDGEIVFVFHTPLKFRGTRIGDVAIPRGFKSDGCSIPRAFWTLIGHPLDIDYMREAFLHDWLYYTQPCSRWTADSVMNDEMRKSGRVRHWRRRLIIFGLRVGGWKAWNAHAERIKAAKEGKATKGQADDFPPDWMI